MKCENCGNENVKIINTVRNTYVCEKCGRDTESLFEIKLYKEIRDKAIEELSCKLMMYFADCQLIEEGAIVRDVLDGVIERIDEIAEKMKDLGE